MWAPPPQGFTRRRRQGRGPGQGRGGQGHQGRGKDQGGGKDEQRRVVDVGFVDGAVVVLSCALVLVLALALAVLALALTVLALTLAVLPLVLVVSNPCVGAHIPQRGEGRVGVADVGRWPSLVNVGCDVADVVVV